MNVKKKRLTYLLIALLLCISVGYAFLSGALKFNTSFSLTQLSFNVHFDNVTPS